jgi:hypothetical protein
MAGIDKQQLEKRPPRLTYDMKNLVALTQGKNQDHLTDYEPSFKGTWNYLNENSCLHRM